VNLPIYLPPLGEPADSPAEGMEAWRHGVRFRPKPTIKYDALSAIGLI